MAAEETSKTGEEKEVIRYEIKKKSRTEKITNRKKIEKSNISFDRIKTS